MALEREERETDSEVGWDKQNILGRYPEIGGKNEIKDK